MFSKATALKLFVIIVTTCLASILGQLLAAASQATFKADESSPRQQSLDKFVYGERVTIDELRPILIGAPREAEVWCNRHHLGDPETRQRTIELIVDKLHAATVKLDPPLFPDTYGRNLRQKGIK